MIDREILEHVYKHKYLVVNNKGTLKYEINGRIVIEERLFNAIKSQNWKPEIVRIIAKPTLFYAYESWAITKKQADSHANEIPEKD